MTEYSFVSLWVIQSPIQPVWEVIKKAEEYPKWFPYVAQATTVADGDKEGVGARVRSRWTTALPYGFEFETEAVRVQEPHLIEVVAGGELDGRGRWELDQDGDTTTVRYFWTVRTTKPWMVLLAPVIRPAFAWNHAVLMRAGGEGIAGHLGAAILRNESFTAESPNPPMRSFPLLG